MASCSLSALLYKSLAGRTWCLVSLVGFGWVGFVDDQLLEF